MNNKDLLASFLSEAVKDELVLSFDLEDGASIESTVTDFDEDWIEVKNVNEELVSLIRISFITCINN